jgi:CRP/FNR family cyclic AMP-dependent transcriptional regulator
MPIDQLESVGHAAELRPLAKDAFLFRAGDKAEALYILVSGLLAVSRDDAKGRRLQFALIEPGTSLGEMGLSQGAPRSADVSAKTDSVLLQIHRSQFHLLVREHPDFALRLMADLSRKLLEANRRLENRVALSVKERLWITLTDLAESGCIHPAPKVTHLATRIDATREMTSKALSQLVREQRVRKESSRVWRIHGS